MERRWIIPLLLVAYGAGVLTMWLVQRGRTPETTVLFPLSPATQASAVPPSSQPSTTAERARLRRNGLGMEFVRIEPGEFRMADVGRKVTLTRPFMMGTTEVTQAQWIAVMGFNPSHIKGDDHPVENMSWNDAVEFCRKLSELEGRQYRLPTEAEWEYACRAGTTSKYHCGEDAQSLAEYAWYGANAGKKTHPVGKKKPNAWGLYDMHGNVWELCSDGYADLASLPIVDPTGQGSSQWRVARSSSWGSDAEGCRTNNRGQVKPDDQVIDVGLRICMDAR